MRMQRTIKRSEDGKEERNKYRNVRRKKVGRKIN